MASLAAQAESGRRRTQAGSTDILFRTLIKKDSGSLQYGLKIGPLSPVTALAISPDGAILAAGGYRSVTLWDLKEGRPTGRIPELAGQVQCVAFNSSGTHLAVAGGEPGRAGQSAVYELKDLSRKTLLLGHTDVVSHIAWSQGGTRLATAGHDKTARIWGWPGGMVRTILRGHSDSVTKVAFEPDGRSVYTASLDRNVRRFDAATGNLIKIYGGTAESISALAVSPDGNHVVSAGPEARMRWWNRDSGDTARISYGSGEVNDLAFSKDGKRLASASADQAVRIWNIEYGGQLRALAGSEDWVFAVALSPDGKLTAGAGADGIIRLWETESGRLRAMLTGNKDEWLAVTPEGYFAGSPGWSNGLRPAVDGKPIADSSTLKFVRTLARPDLVAAALKLGEVTPAVLPAPSMPAPSKKESH